MYCTFMVCAKGWATYFGFFRISLYKCKHKIASEWSDLKLVKWRQSKACQIKSGQIKSCQTEKLQQNTKIKKHRYHVTLRPSGTLLFSGLPMRIWQETAKLEKNLWKDINSKLPFVIWQKNCFRRIQIDLEAKRMDGSSWKKIYYISFYSILNLQIID